MSGTFSRNHCVTGNKPAINLFEVTAIRLQATTKKSALARESEYLATLLVLLTVYFLAGKLGLKLAFVHANATAVWPPTGIALASLLVLGHRVWPAIFLGAFLVNITTPGLVATSAGITAANGLAGLGNTFLVNISTVNSVAASLGIATGNTLEGLLGACLVNRFAGGRNAFDHPRTVFKFALLAGVMSTMVSATIGVTSLSLSGAARWADYGAIWLTWWLGDAVGAQMVAPFFILWSARLRPQWSPGKTVEAALFFLALALICRVVFAGLLPPGIQRHSLTFLCVPFVVWAAFRFGPRGTVAVSCLVSGIALWGTLNGYGPFAADTQNESLILLQSFMGVIGVMALAVAAVVSEQRRTEKALREARDGLEWRVKERTAELAKANQALQASREQLAEAQEIAQVGSWEWDLASNSINWSDTLYRIYGLKPHEIPLTYKNFLEYMHPDDRSFVRDTVEKAIRDHKPFSFDHRIIRPDGRERMLHGRGEVIVDEAGQAIRMIGTGQDITERKEAEALMDKARSELEKRVQERTGELAAANEAFLAEILEHKRTAEALRDSQTKFQAIFENSIDAIGVSKNGIQVLANPAYLKMFGYSRVEEAAGRPVLELVAPGQREMIRERIQRRAAGDSPPSHYETRGLRNGTEFDLEVEVSSYKLKGEVFSLVILRDVTERKRAEQLVRESEALKSAILESAMDGVVAIDHEGKIMEWNTAAEKTFGLSRADALGRPMIELIIPPSLRETYRQGFARFQATGESRVSGRRVEMTAIRADGGEFPVELTLTAIPREGPPAFTGFLRDITERKRAEEALRQSQARKGAILETALDAILSIDRGGTVLEWNPAAEKIFGYRKADALGRKMDELIIPPSLREYYHDSLAEYLTTGVGSLLGRPVEVTVMRVDGTEFRAELAITCHSPDEPSLYTCFIRDITERKRAEEARNQLAAIVESSDDAIISKTLDGTIVSWNAGAQRIFGYSAEEVVSRSILLLIPPELPDEEKEILERLRRGEPCEHYETVRVRKDGSRIDVSLTISPVRDAAGRVIGASKIARDITERKRAEDRLRRVVEAAPNAMLMVDSQGRMTMVNSQTERLFGWSRQELLGQPVELLVPERYRAQHPGQRAGFFKKPDARPMGAGRDLFGLRKNSTEVPIEIGLNPIATAEGTFVLASIIDITERKRVEAEIRKLNEDLEERVVERTAQLEAINRELESFTYSVSHDLRAPLRAMQGLSNALLEDYLDRLDNTGKDYCRRIATAAARMDTLIQDLLAYSRLSRTDLELKNVELAAVLADVRHQLESDLRERQAELAVHDDLPAVRGHRATLVQMLGNLVSNAVKFVAPGATPRVRLWAEKRGEFVRLWIEDNGIGIAKEHQGRIFRVFERLHGVETYPGTGIGLAIVQKGAERLGGRVGVESTEGAGSKFWIELKKVSP